MKRCGMFLLALALGLMAAPGCEDPDSITTATVDKPPPPGGGGPREIAFIESVRIQGSPSGNRQYCIRGMAVDGSNVATISCPGGGTFFTDISWEPAGTAIAYTVNSTLNYGAWRVNVDGTNAIQLLAPGQYNTFSDVAWSSAGNEIAVTAQGPSSESVLLLIPSAGCPWPNPSDPCPKVLYSEPGGGADWYFSSLAWSPDGTQIALKVSRGTGNGVIVLVDHAMGTATDVRAWDGGVGDWGRGQRATTLVLPRFTGVGNEQDIYLFDLATPGVAPVLTVQLGRHPNFSADGEYIVYQEISASSLAMVKRELDTGTKTVLLKSGGLHPNWRKP